MNNWYQFCVKPDPITENRQKIAAKKMVPRRPKLEYIVSNVFRSAENLRRMAHVLVVQWIAQPAATECGCDVWRGVD